MAPGGVEPPHADSKSAALSAELRGRRGGELDRVALRLRFDGDALAVLRLVRERHDRRRERETPDGGRRPRVVVREVDERVAHIRREIRPAAVDPGEAERVLV